MGAVTGKTGQAKLEETTAGLASRSEQNEPLTLCLYASYDANEHRTSHPMCRTLVLGHLHAAYVAAYSLADRHPHRLYGVAANRGLPGSQKDFSGLSLQSNGPGW